MYHKNTNTSGGRSNWSKQVRSLINTAYVKSCQLERNARINIHDIAIDLHFSELQSTDEEPSEHCFRITIPKKKVNI